MIGEEKAMTRSFGYRLFIFWLSLLAWEAVASAAPAQSTAFNYQGKLTEGGIAANGPYDFQFKLFDAVSGGTQQGASVTQPTVQVSGGVFTVQLDFGALVFDGSARYLEIGVRPASSGNPYAVLAPRQPITATPYAIQTLNATQLGGLPASRYVATDANGNINIGGNGTAGGTLSGNVINATTQFNINGNRVLNVTGTNNLFAGSGAGQANTIGTDNAFFGFNTGRNNIGDAFGNGSDNSFFGSQAGLSNTGSQNSFFGFAAGSGNMAGSFNSFFGNGAGSGNTGSSNSFFGASAGTNNTADGNSFFGSGAGLNNTSGDGNVFLGYQAGNANTRGAANTFVGYQAGANTVSGGRPGTGVLNSFFGYRAGINNTVGGSNTFIGANAGNPDSGAQASDSVAIGSGAKVSNALCVAIGSGASASGIGSIAIGFNATASADYTVALGARGGNTFIKGDVHLDNDGGTNLYLDATGFGGHKWRWIAGTASQHYGVGNGFGLFDDSVGAYRLAVDERGFVGINTPSPVFQLDVAGAAHASSFPTSSDARLKMNVAQLTNVLDKIEKIRGVSFDWNGLYQSLGRSTGHREMGVVAQEVEAVFPELVTRWGEAGYRAVDYGRLTAALIEAVKELRAEKDAQVEGLRVEKDEQINLLRAENALLRRQNAAMDTRLIAVELRVKKKAAHHLLRSRRRNAANLRTRR
jgi:Chaperone of endosialidase/Head domain of trimeric autotransporter adhesin